MTDPWKEATLQTILTNYAKTSIYNAEEFGLFFKALPNKTLHLKDEKCTGGKHSKIRMTRLAAANMNGEKLPIFVIDKSQSLDVSRISKNYLAFTNARRKVGWIQRFSKNGSESLIINLKKKTRKLHSSSITVQPILKLED